MNKAAASCTNKKTNASVRAVNFVEAIKGKNPSIETQTLVDNLLSTFTPHPGYNFIEPSKSSPFEFREELKLRERILKGLRDA